MKTYKILSLFIAILFSQSLFAGNIVTGNITDSESGKPVVGASVIVKGTRAGTITDNKGNYSIGIPTSGKILVFSFLGYTTHEEEIKNQKQINVKLVAEVEIEIEVDEEVTLEPIHVRKEAQELSFAKMSTRGSGRKHGSPFKRKQKSNFYDDSPIHNTEEYDNITENEFQNPLNAPLSTLSIDVDNASYSNVRRFINSGQLPDKNAVRIEEMINYFSYDYKEPTGKHPFSFVTETSECPWNNENKLLHVGIQGKRLDRQNLKASNLVFLLDVSGSMESPNKLPLLRNSLMILLDELSQQDKVTIVVYAGAAGMVLPPTAAYKKDEIKAALNKLSAGGSTAGGAGIELAYKMAKKSFIKGGNNRVILATDGDFNVGTSSTGTLVDLITEKRKDDIYLTILGFGMGNYKDGRMEQISNAGNGNYFYIDNQKEANKVFKEEMRANMCTVAKDVKIQIEFNPAKVQSYRLIGYENRVLAAKDFNDDKKDAGELGPGHTVTALYEIVPATSNKGNDDNSIDKLKYQTSPELTKASASKELMTIKFRYKPPTSNKSILVEHVAHDDKLKLSKTSDSFRFSAAVATFGMLLRDSKFKDKADYTLVLELAKGAMGEDKNKHREEFIKLVKVAEKLAKK